MKVGRRWCEGTATILPDDDIPQRLRWLGRPVNDGLLLLVGTEQVRIRIDLERWPLASMARDQAGLEAGAEATARAPRHPSPARGRSSGGPSARAAAVASSAAGAYVVAASALGVPVAVVAVGRERPSPVALGRAAPVGLGRVGPGERAHGASPPAPPVGSLARVGTARRVSLLPPAASRSRSRRYHIPPRSSEPQSRPGPWRVVAPWQG